MLLGLACWTDWIAYGDQMRETRTAVANLASSLTQHAEGTVEMADTVLAGVVERLQADGTGAAALARLDHLLSGLRTTLPRIRDYIVYDEHGDWLATSLPAKHGNASDRAYFIHHHDDPSSAIFIGPPIQSRSTGRWIITLSRRVQRADGSFAGVALAMVDVAYFTDYYASFDLGANKAVALLTASGTMLARTPFVEGVIGRDMSSSAVFSDLREHNAGSRESTALVDGVQRITGYRRSDRYPLVVGVAMSKHEAFASWRREAGMHLAIASVLSFIIAMLGLRVTRQILQREAMEDRLRENEARYRLLTESSGDLIALRPSSGVGHAYVSPASRAIVGYDPLELATMPGGLAIHPDDLDRVTADENALTAANPRIASVHRVRHKNGDWIWIEALYQLVQAGQPGESIVLTIRDVTSSRHMGTELAQRARALEGSNAELTGIAKKLAAARDAAEQANVAKSRFLAGMSHELRTPLHGILGNAALLRTEGPLNAGQDARLDAMLDAGAHLLQMISRVLDLSQIEAERLELQTAVITLRSVAAACLDLVRPDAAAKALALRLVVAPDVPAQVIADVTRLRQILLNLLGNAVKFTRAGSVELRLRATGGAPDERHVGLVMEVADTGPGIPCDRRSRLFQDFDRLNADAAGRVEGAGLGLALSFRLAALMGGSLSHTDNPGGGSVFALSLPLPIAENSVAHPAPGALAPQAARAKRRLRVLVVDDVAINRDIAGSFLRAGDHSVTCVESGVAAVSAAAAADFDVVLMDVRMPGMDGLEATRRIRALSGARGQVPIVAVTAQAFTDQVAACREAGMDHHLTKPFVPEALLEAVTSVAEAWHARLHRDAHSLAHG